MLSGLFRRRSKKNLTVTEFLAKYPGLNFDITARPEFLVEGVNEQIKILKDSDYRNKELNKRLSKIFSE